jgi:uncharacterized membrane protein
MVTPLGGDVVRRRRRPAVLLGSLIASVDHRCRYTLPGLWVALVLAALSFTPSLLPRPALFQGAVTGIDAAIGYGLGVLGAWVWREFADRPPRPPTARSRRVLDVVAVVALVVAFVAGERWQHEVARLVHQPAGSTLLAVLVVPLSALVTFVVLVAAGRTLRTAYRRTARLLTRHMGARAARATSLVVLVAVVVLLATGVVWRVVVGAADASFAAHDALTPDDVARPGTGLRSGGPGSLVPWDSLGREGRVFTAGGPDADQVAAVTGTEARQPIRVYAGVASAGTPQQRADLAVRDLDRAGGFDRADLLVVTTTGTGWVEPSAAASFEYLTGGDSALVAMQYSHLPSWLSFLVDQTKAREAGRDLFDAVYEHWSRLPTDDRPRLFVFGESLGAFGAENAFSGEHDLANRTSGGLFVGPPSATPSYRRFVDERDPGSPEVEPVYQGGRIVRFSNLPRATIPPGEAPWPGSRVLYLQHPSDPIVWWSPRLLLHRPDWLTEPRGRDVLGATRWIPFVTFWQLSADLALGFSTTAGHGHNYTGEHVDGWAAVLQPDGWTPARADELRRSIRAATR